MKNAHVVLGLIVFTLLNSGLTAYADTKIGSICGNHDASTNLDPKEVKILAPDLYTSPSQRAQLPGLRVQVITVQDDNVSATLQYNNLFNFEEGERIVQTLRKKLEEAKRLGTRVDVACYDAASNSDINKLITPTRSGGFGSRREDAGR